MKTKAAIAYAAGKPLEITTVDLDGPKDGEVLLRELELEQHNLSRLARKLGVSRNALYRKMHRLAIPWPLKGVTHGCTRSGRP